MATFELKIATESQAELVSLVTKMCGQTVTTTLGTRSDSTTPLPELPVALGTPQVQDDQEDTPAATNATRPERDKHGIKYDSRVHANAAEPFKVDGTWKRRKNLSDTDYDNVMDELQREAFAAGVYTGPELASLQLESQVVETSIPTPAVAETSIPTPAVAETSIPTPAVAETSIPTPEPTTGMSAEDAPLATKVLVELVKAAGPAAAKLFLNACGATTHLDVSVEHRRAGMAIATAIQARAIPANEKVTKGPQALAEEAINYGIVVTL